MYTETRAPFILMSLWVMSGIACLFMLLRFYCKYRFSKTFGWDDYILTISWALNVLYAAFLSVAARHGMGSHLLEIPQEDTYWLNFWLDHGLTSTILAVSLSKTSFAITLLRFAPQKWQRHMIWFVIASVNTSMTLVVILQYAQCIPIQKRWNSLLPGTCYDHHIIIYFSMFAGAYSALWDFLLATLPWFIIWKLKMNTREKVGVALAMSFGVLAGITACLKTSYLPRLGHWQDFTWQSSNLLIMSGAESTTTIIGASIPFLRVLVKGGSLSKGNSYSLKTITFRNRTANASSTGRVPDRQSYMRHHDNGSDASFSNEYAQGREGTILQTNGLTHSHQEDVHEENQLSRPRNAVV